MDATLNEPLVDTERLATLIQRLTTKQALLPDVGDLKSANERARHYAINQEITGTLIGLRNPNLGKPTTQLADLETRRNAAIAKRAELEEALAEIPEVIEIRDRHDREAWHRRQHLTTQLQLFDRGLLYRAPGETYDPLDYLESRIGEVRATLDQRRAVLAATIETAERLLAAR